MTSIPVVLLTNGSLLSQSRIRYAACAADVVKASLSAWDQPSFERINRPHAGLHFRVLVQGLRLMREALDGQLWLEVMVLAGVNDTVEQMSQIAALAATIEPDVVHLNTVERPPAEAAARPVDRGHLERLAALFTPKAVPVGRFQAPSQPQFRATEAAIVGILQRRPCTGDEIARANGFHPNEVAKYTTDLVQSGRVSVMHQHGQRYFVLNE